MNPRFLLAGPFWDFVTVYYKNVGIKQSEIACQMGIPPSTLRTILSNRTKIEETANQSKFTSARKRFRTAKYDNVEAALLTCMQQARANNVPVSGPMLQTKAVSLADQLGYSAGEFKCSSGWLSRFKERHGIASHQVCGEAAAVSGESMDPWLSQTLPKILTKYKVTVRHLQC